MKTRATAKSAVPLLAARLHLSPELLPGCGVEWGEPGICPLDWEVWWGGCHLCKSLTALIISNPTHTPASQVESRLLQLSHLSQWISQQTRGLPGARIHLCGPSLSYPSRGAGPTLTPSPPPAILPSYMEIFLAVLAL